MITLFFFNPKFSSIFGYVDCVCACMLAFRVSASLNLSIPEKVIF
jgi:hypothetical protein